MLTSPDSSWLGYLKLQSRQNLFRCFDCARCTAGCPVAFAMQYGPHRILQLLRFGMKEAVLTSPDIWLCAGCQTCGSRCPNDVDVAALMDELRRLSLAEGARNPAADIADFHRLFLALVKSFGRMHEASLLALFKLRTRDWFGDLLAGGQLIVRGKIPLLPERIKGTSQLRHLT